jgi:hypothetical protein
MFFGSFAEANKNEVVLEDVEAKTFVTLLNLLFVCTFELKGKIYL